MTTKTIKIDELNNNFPSDFDRELEQWRQQEIHDIDVIWPEWSEDMAKNLFIGTGWKFDKIAYSVGHCQGDHVSIEASFHIEQCSEDQLHALKGDFPILVEVMEQGWMMVESVIGGRSQYSRPNWECDLPPYDEDDPNDVIEDGVYKGLHLSVVDQLIDEEGIEDFVNTLFEIVERVQSTIYKNLSDDILYRYSEEYFIEEARDLDFEFEVEVEDEEEQLSA